MASKHDRQLCVEGMRAEDREGRGGWREGRWGSWRVPNGGTVGAAVEGDGEGHVQEEGGLHGEVEVVQDD